MSCENNEKRSIRGEKKGEEKRKLSMDFDESVEQKAKKVIRSAKIQLDEMIEHLDAKIKKRMQINEYNFVMAYQNHLDKITKELKILKETYDVHQRKFSADNAIVHLGKQCTLFRQQAMRLHSQLEDALAEANIYKRKSQILQKQLKKSNDYIKSLMYSNKNIRAEKVKIVMESKIKDEKISEITARMNNIQNQQEKIKQSKLDMCIKIPEAKQIKIEGQMDWMESNLNLCKTQQKNLPKYTTPHYNIFEKRFDLQSPQTGRKSSVKLANKKRNKTSSSLCYNESRTKGSTKHFYSQIKIVEEKSNEQAVFKGFMNLIKKVRGNQKIISDSPAIISNNFREFIGNDIDVSNLCRILFQNLNLEQNNSIGYQTSRKINSPKMKTLTYLSSELMKKIELSRVKLSDTSSDKNLHLSSDQLEYICNKSKGKKGQDEKIKQVVSSREGKLRKMNESFKRKTVPNQSVLSFAQRSARLRLQNSKK